MEATGFDAWALSLAVFLPLIGVGVMALFPKEQEETHKLIALVTSLVALAMGIYLLANYDFDRGDELQFLVDNSWIDVINSRYIIGIDGISLPLLILSLAVIPLCIIYSWNHIPEPGNPKAFLMLILILATGMNGTFVAQDLILFFVFFEVVLLPMYFMIGVWGGDDRRYASIKFFLYTLFGSALMIISFLALFFLSQEQTFDMRLLTEFQGEGIARASQLWVFAGMFMGFGSKVPMFPFHTWLPDAHTQAPTVGSVILAAVLLKLGTYGFVRIAIPMLPEAAAEWAPWIGLLAVIGIIYGALGCLAQTDMKRLIAFSSVAHMGFVMLGISTMTDFGINAAIFGMVAHGLIAGMLFFLAGSIKERYHTLEIARLGGLLVDTAGRRDVGLQPGADPPGRDLPHIHGDRRAGHRARSRLPAVAVPAHRLRHAEGGVGRRRDRGRHHRRAGGLDPVPPLHRRVRRAARPLVRRDRRRGRAAHGERERAARAGEGLTRCTSSPR